MEAILDNIKRFFQIIVDFPYILQTVSVAMAISIIFGFPQRDLKIALLEVLKCLSTVVVMIVSNLLLSILSVVVSLHGEGLWVPYLCGVIFYILVYCKNDLRINIIYGGVILALSVIVAQIGMTVGNTLSEYFPGFPIMAAKLASDALILIFAYLFRKYGLRKYEINNLHVTLNLGINLLSVVIVVIHDIYNMRNFRNAKAFFLTYSIILCCLYLINILAYFMTRALCKEGNSVLQLKIERQRNKAIEEMKTVSEYNYKELCEIKHDLKNQYMYMQQLLLERDYDKLKKYFEEMTGTFAEPLYRAVDCGNHHIDTIMNMEKAKAEANGIKTDIKIVVPKEIPIAELDLFNICINLIDNAIESCVRENYEDAIIQILMDVQGDYLRLKVANPIKAVKPNVTTSKENKKQHGYGLRIVKKLVKKYNGMYYFKMCDNEYNAEIYLDLKQEQIGEDA